MWRPGELNERISLKRETTATDALGGQTVTLSTYATTWAKVKPISGREQYLSDQLQADFDYLFVVRNRESLSILANDRITWRGTDYNIRSVAESGFQPMYLEIYAERGVAQ